MEKQQQNRTYRLNRTDKRLRKFKGMMLCEWCNRWSNTGKGKMPMSEWKSYVENRKITGFWCKREACILARET